MNGFWDFAKRHPILTFLSVDTIVCGIAHIFDNTLRYKAYKDGMTERIEDPNENDD